MRFAFLLLVLLRSVPVSAQDFFVDTVLLQHKSDIPFAGIGLPQKTIQDKLGRSYLYVAAKEGGLLVYEISNITQPVLKKTLPVSAFEGQEVMNLFQEGEYLYLALGNFFGGVNPPGLAIVNISAPENAYTTDDWVAETVGKGCAFVTVSGNYAYLGAMSEGLIILDIFNKSQIGFVSQFIPDIHFPTPNPTAVQLPNARGMEVRHDTAWLCYDAGGLRLIDVSDKWHPAEVGRYINSDALGKQQAYNNIVLEGGKAYVAIDYCGLEMLDISDPDNVEQISWWNPWNCQSPENAWINSPGHSNQIELDTARRLVFLSTGRSELNIVDVSDAASPRQAGTYGTPDDNYFAWGASIQGDRVYLSYFASLFPFFSIWSGVRILEWDAVTASKEIAGIRDFCFYPNPFRQALSLDFELENDGQVRIEIMDIQGKVVAQVLEANLPGGQHSLQWKGDLLSGIYFLKMTSDQGIATRKLVRNPD